MFPGILQKKKTVNKMKSNIPFALMLSLTLLCPSCKEKPVDDGDEPNLYTVTVDPAVTYQEMIGFGGSLTWYSDRITNSPDKNKICNCCSRIWVWTWSGSKTTITRRGIPQ